MSHFSVLVITKKHPNDVSFDDILERYWEELDVPYYVSQTKEQIIKIERENRDNFKKNQYAQYLGNPEEYSKKCSKQHLEYVSTIFPKEILNATDEELYQRRIKDYPTYDEREYDKQDYVNEDGAIMSCYNPNSKWDWWVIGGRWDGSLQLKSGKTANFAQIKDVDWGNEVSVEDYIKRFPDVEKLYQELITKGDFYKPEYYQAIYPTLEQFILSRVRYSSFAVITADGMWHEKGSMGWFGCSSETPEEHISWENNYYDTFIKGKEDYYATVIDCHI